jgi:hypothetical protein
MTRVGSQRHRKKFPVVFFSINQIDLLSATGLTPGGSSTVLIYIKTIHITTQLIWEECGPCPVFASYTLEFVLQVRKKPGKTSVRVAEECQLARCWHDENRIYRTEHT